jgi:hypothetical protein
LGDRIRAAGKGVIAAPPDQFATVVAAQLQQIITPPYRIETGAIGDTATAIMSHTRKAIIAELSHHLDQGASHGALGISRLHFVARWASALPVAREIGANHRKARCEERRNGMPHQMCFRKPV